MSQKIVSLIRIVVLLIAIQILRNTTDWNGLVILVAGVGIAFALTAVIVFLVGALGLSKENAREK